MGYNTMKSRQEIEAERAAHPVWRGIGFTFMILVPVLAFGIADSALQYMRLNVPGFTIPAQLQGSRLIWDGFVVENFWAVILMTILFSLLIYGLYSVIVAIVHSLSTTPKLEDMSINVKGQAYKPKRKYKNR